MLVQDENRGCRESCRRTPYDLWVTYVPIRPGQSDFYDAMATMAGIIPADGRVLPAWNGWLRPDDYLGWMIEVVHGDGSHQFTGSMWLDDFGVSVPAFVHDPMSDPGPIGKHCRGAAQWATEQWAMAVVVPFKVRRRGGGRYRARRHRRRPHSQLERARRSWASPGA